VTQPVQATALYTVREVPEREATRSEWDGWLQESPGGGHVLQSYEWGEFKKRLGWKPVRAVLERNGETAGLGQFLSYNTGPVLPGSLWYCTKGPWLNWDDGEAVRAFFDGARAIAARRGAHTIKIEPEVSDERDDVKKLLGGIGFQKARYDLNFKHTLLIDLTEPEEDLLSQMKSKMRYNVRLAGRKGVEVSEPGFEEAWPTFYGWMKEMEDRKEGFTIRRSHEYLRAMMKTMHDTGRGRFFFAAHEGTPLAGIYVFTFGEKCWYMHGASGSEKRNLMPAHRLQWEVMRWAKQHGITYYDMVGVPKPEDMHEVDPMWGVYKFKSGFGGEVVDFLGCLDLPVKRTRAAAWHRFEPVYYRLYYKLKHDVFY
jgi:peptidoglycan pentaglycine glycine transferase (the first glycine)